jgi:hypothetical protein
MDKDLRSLMQAIEKVIASDHRIRDSLSKPKQGCNRTDQDVARTVPEESAEHAG